MDKDTFYEWVSDNGLVINSNMQLCQVDGDDEYQYLSFFDEDTLRVQGKRVSISAIEDIIFNNDIKTISITTFGDKDYTLKGKKRQIRTADAPAMPKTDSELTDIFSILYPDYQTKLFYDVMMEKEIVDESLFDDTVPEGSFVGMDEAIEIKYYDNIERKLKQNGFTGNPPNTTVRLRVLLGRIYATKRNLFKEWVTSHKWDGVKRMDTWFQKVFGATAPPLREYGLEDIYLAKVSRAWFMGAMQRMDRETVHEVVPVLISPQGSCRKTSGLRYTAGKPQWFKDVLSDVTTPIGMSKFLDAARGRVVIELAESTALRTKDQDALKGFISMSSDQYRKPYARREQTWPRHFILAATSNLDDVFTDLTGNRRYYPMFCTPSDFSYRTQYNVEQVWAEAYELYRRGEPNYIDSQWAPARLMQSFATQENPHVTAIDNFLNDPMSPHYKIGALITKEDIMQEFYGLSPTSTIPKETETAYRAWRRGTKYWSQTSQSVRRNGKVVKAMERVALPGYDPRENAMHFTDADIAKIKAEFDEQTGEADEVPIEVYARREFERICVDNDLRYENEIFPQGDLPKEVLDWLVENGFLYMKNNIYRIVTFNL